MVLDDDKWDEIYITEDKHLVLRDRKGFCYILSGRDCIGKTPLNQLTYLGRYKLCV